MEADASVTTEHTMKRLPDRLLEQLAERFKALSEPARLRILRELRGGERSVSELIDATGLNQANVSKHLQVLHAHYFVARRKEGLFVYYRLADEDVFRLCDLVCDRMERELEVSREVVRQRRRA
jgi:DNA-binding transcriptional ArsR family regulator